MLLVQNGCTDPYYNLACEETLLTQSDEDICMLWRNDNTIVVGRNQNTYAEINADFVRAHGIRVVRRMSGGGAVYHDLGNINYTFITGGAAGAFSDYATFTQPILAFLGSLGVDARLEGRNDLVIDGRKFSGNAQYLYHDRLLHHGTLLLSTPGDILSGALNASPEKIRSKGIRSVRSRVTNIAQHLPTPLSPDEFLDALYRYLLRTQPDVRAFDIRGYDADILRLREEKYATWAWNYGYSPRYETTVRRRYPFGTVEATLHVGDGGTIEEIRLYGDFFSQRPVEELEALLRGVRRNEYDLAQVVNTTDIGAYIAGMTNEDFINLLGE